jgi:hypothetical protein
MAINVVELAGFLVDIPTALQRLTGTAEQTSKQIGSTDDSSNDSCNVPMCSSSSLYSDGLEHHHDVVE